MISTLIARAKDSSKNDNKLQKIVGIIRVTQQPHKNFTWESGILRRKGKLVVGNDVGLKITIIQQFHDSPLGGHSGYDLTYKRIREHFIGNVCANKLKVG